MNYEQIIREACVKANPDNFRFYCSHPDCDVLDCTESGEGHNGEPIRLADVLLAIGIKYPAKNPMERRNPYISCDMDGSFIDVDELEVGKWNLRADNLSLQSDETKMFLAGLLSDKH